jgi:hypothetical protein
MDTLKKGNKMYKFIYRASQADVSKSGQVLTFPSVWAADFYAEFYGITDRVRVVPVAQ